MQVRPQSRRLIVAVALIASFVLVGSLGLEALQKLFPAGCVGGPTAAITDRPNGAVLVNGIVITPSGMSATDFSIIALGHRYPVGCNGTFTAVAYPHGVTAFIAVPSRKKTFGLIAIDAAVATTPVVRLDADSTAAGLVFLNPLFSTGNAQEASVLLKVMTTDPQVVALAALVPSLLREDDPVADPRVQGTVVAAVGSVRDTLLATPSNSPATLRGAELLRIGVDDASPSADGSPAPSIAALQTSSTPCGGEYPIYPTIDQTQAHVVQTRGNPLTCD